MSYLKPIAVAAVLLVFAWPISAELVERRHLQNEIATSERAGAQGPATAASSADRAGMPVGESSPAVLTALRPSSGEPKGAQRVPSARELGEMLGAHKAESHRFRERYKGRRPDSNDAGFADYLAEMDALARQLGTIMTDPLVDTAFEKMAEDQTHMAIVLANSVGRSLRLDEPQKARLETLFTEAASEREARGLQNEARAKDPEQWQAGMNRLSAEVLEKIRAEIGSEKTDQITYIHGSGFLYSMNFELPSGTPRPAE